MVHRGLIEAWLWPRCCEESLDVLPSRGGLGAVRECQSSYQQGESAGSSWAMHIGMWTYSHRSVSDHKLLKRLSHNAFWYCCSLERFRVSKLGNSLLGRQLVRDSTFFRLLSDSKSVIRKETLTVPNKSAVLLVSRFPDESLEAAAH